LSSMRLKRPRSKLLYARALLNMRLKKNSMTRSIKSSKSSSKKKLRKRFLKLIKVSQILNQKMRTNKFKKP